MTRARFWPGGALDVSPRSEDEVLAEREAILVQIADEARRAAWGDELAALVDFARSPLPDLPHNVPSRTSPEPLPPRLARALRAEINSQIRRGFAGLLKTRQMLAWTEPPGLAASAAPAPRSRADRRARFSVDFQRRRVLTAAGREVPGGFEAVLRWQRSTRRGRASRSR